MDREAVHLRSRRTPQIPDGTGVSQGILTCSRNIWTGCGIVSRLKQGAVSQLRFRNGAHIYRRGGQSCGNDDRPDSLQPFVFSTRRLSSTENTPGTLLACISAICLSIALATTPVRVT